MNAPVALQPFIIDGPQDCGAIALARSLERGRLQCYLALMVADIAALFAGFAVAGLVTQGAGGLISMGLLASVVLPIFLTIALYDSSYSIDALRRPSLGIARTEAAMLVSAAAVVFIAFYEKSSVAFPRLGFTLGVLCSMMALFVTRQQMRRFVGWRCGMDVINQLVIDDGGPQVDMPGAIQVCASAMGLAPTLQDPDSLDRLGLVLRKHRSRGRKLPS